MVDDEDKFRETTGKILKKKGYDTTMAKSGEEAVEILKTQPYDVIILDIKMEGMDGHQTLVKIREIQPDAKVIMLTGHGSIESAKESLLKGASDYLIKPCDIDLLSQKIKAIHSHQSEHPDKVEKSAEDLMIAVDDYGRVNSGDTILKAVETLMTSYGNYIASSRLIYSVHRSTLVYNEQGVLEGILSVRKLLEALRPAYLTAAKPPLADAMQYSPLFWTGLFTSQVKALGKKQVREIMDESLVSVDAKANLMEVAEAMFRHKTRRVVILKDKKAIGIVREQELFFEIAGILKKSF